MPVDPCAGHGDTAFHHGGGLRRSEEIWVCFGACCGRRCGRRGATTAIQRRGAARRLQQGRARSVRPYPGERARRDPVEATPSRGCVVLAARGAVGTAGQALDRGRLSGCVGAAVFDWSPAGMFAVDQRGVIRVSASPRTSTRTVRSATAAMRLGCQAKLRARRPI